MKGKTKAKSIEANLTEKVKLRLPEDYPWKVLGAMVNDLVEFLTEEDVAFLSQIIRKRDIAAISSLGELWGLQNQSIDPAMKAWHISEKRAKYQLSALLKKFRFNTEKDMRKNNALRKFREAELACLAFNQSGYMALACGETEDDACVLTYARSFLRKLLGESSPSKQIVTHWSRHGPGTNLDTLKGQASTYYKFDNWPYSCTELAIPYARFLIESDRRWLGALEDDYRERFSIPKHAILDRETFWDNVLKVVEGNRIAFVPKNALTERSIAIEPAMNLMLQLGVDGYIRQRLKRWDVNLDDQTKNQVLAYRGSIDPTSRSYVTLDMSMASDTISLKLCQLLLPSEWYSYLCKIRSPKGCCEGELFNYQKISSMGNGFTFALESAIFAAITYAATKVALGSCSFKNDMSIFGDDIICRQDASSQVIRALNSAGFTLNTDKSFLQGDVRESCGTDWISGKPVRPVFLSDSPTDAMELLVDYNRLKRILSLRWGIEKSKTLMMIAKWIPETIRDYIGPFSDEDFDSYIHSTEPPGQYTNCMWKYARLIRKPIVIEVSKFLTRKLMHNLRGAEMVPSYISRKKAISGKGSRFTVCKSHSYTVGETYSVTSHWSSNYTEHLPVLASNRTT